MPGFRGIAGWSSCHSGRRKVLHLSLASLNVAIELSAFGGNCQVMHQNTSKAEPEPRWEKIPLPANLDDLDLITILKIMERLEYAYLDGERELNRLN